MSQNKPFNDSNKSAEKLGETDRLVAENEQLRIENEYLKEQLETLKKWIFGRKSEKLHYETSHTQLSLFEEPESFVQEEQESEEDEIPFPRIFLADELFIPKPQKS